MTVSWVSEDVDLQCMQSWLASVVIGHQFMNKVVDARRSARSPAMSRARMSAQIRCRISANMVTLGVRSFSGPFDATSLKRLAELVVSSLQIVVGFTKLADRTAEDIWLVRLESSEK